MHKQNKQSVSHYSQHISIKPIPDPSDLEQYNKICPGAAEKIIQMAIDEQSHRHSIETRIVKSSFINERIGILASFLLTALFGFLSVYTAISGVPSVGAVLGGSSIIAILSGFLKKNNKTDKE
ncbi:MAG: hypothetical protein A2Y41_07280 [Spirochaetes bacterium GWB1_36_13]|nr:MAG: hypothetical protein A2Y41_07280 [Spirochaetes bacterium GWB1_36_13]